MLHVNKLCNKSKNVDNYMHQGDKISDVLICCSCKVYDLTRKIISTKIKGAVVQLEKICKNVILHSFRFLISHAPHHIFNAHLVFKFGSPLNHYLKLETLQNGFG